MSKKTRGPNFSSNEKEILIHLVTKYKDVVENKKTDATTTAVKNEGWRKLTEEFNSMSTFSVRNSEQLKTCWDNIKRNTRKDKAAMKKEIILTGGGRPNLPPPGPFQGQVEILLGPTLDGLDNPFDSDASIQTKIPTDCEIQVIENEPADQLGVSESREDDCKMVVPENEPAGPSGISKSREDECLMVLPEDHKNKMWNGWSPAALKTKVADSLVTSKKTSSPWLHRRRPKASVHDKLLQTKLELVELMKKNAESEATINQLILKEKLKQEKIKTEVLELQLKQAQQKNY